MAQYLPDKGQSKKIDSLLTLTMLQTYVGGFIKFVDLPSGDVMVVNEAGPEFAAINVAASKLAGQTIHGHVVVCSPSEIA